MIDAGNNMIGLNFLFEPSLLFLLFSFISQPLTYSTRRYFYIAGISPFFLSIHSIYFSYFLISFIPFYYFFPRLVAGSRFFFLLIFYRVQIRIMNMCYLQKTKKKEMHIIYTRGARRMGLGQEINWIY